MKRLPSMSQGKAACTPIMRRVVGVPGGLVLFGLVEGIHVDLLDPGPRLRETDRVVHARTLDVLAQGEFDEAVGAVDQHLARGRAPTHLDQGRLTTDRVGRTVQQLGGSDATGQLPVDVDVLGIDHVTHADHARIGGDVVDAAERQV